MRKTFLLMAGLALSLAVIGSPAQAHKVKAFATATGTAIDGYAYFSPGGRAQQVAVRVTAPDGTLLATTTTDGDGNFHIEAKRRIDHRITVEGGDGHLASYTVAASELPDSLPGPLGQTAPPTPAPTAAASAPMVEDSTLRSFIDQSIARQIRPLREQIDGYQEKIWWHDVLGGIGTILGLGGLAFGFSERQRRKTQVPPA